MNHFKHCTTLYKKFTTIPRSYQIRLFCQQSSSPKTKWRPSLGSSNYANHWRLDRAFSWILLGVLPLGLTYPCKALDVIIAICVVGHQQTGLSSVVTDYVRKDLLRGMATKAAHGVTAGLSVATLVGLLYLTFADIGITETVRRIWAVQPKESNV
ncbi:AAEL002383-PA [Aedes aegypti]|uniref:Succinate dehydrogenase [ubiquinone] cytochrome b small subunit n=2 Tax=Aedes aegypti TaxID=7159 RepID=Q17IC3_AEDAE|nr:succinate dehydrogenase [ubiquinone] cytochrome b small subunit, mitochondrial [Aedes aegypti]EAT46455.1 AAEL002383-PA [Aedes aegypti]